MALHGPRLRLATMLAVSLSWLGLHLALVADTLPTRTGDPPPTLGADIARGAREVTSATRHKWPLPTVYQSIRHRLELNVQQHHDSDAFLVGAHLATVLWLEDVPEDVPWREKAL